MTDPVLRLERLTDGVALVTLHRPEVRNALNAELRRALTETMLDLDGDDEVGAIVLTGTDPAFCAGLDLKELGATAGSLAGGTDPGNPGGGGALPEIDTPVIGAINGVAVTGGFELALACDFLVAGPHARFADTHVRVGIQPGWGLTVALPQAVGLRRARELSFTGNYLDADTALAWGLVNHLVDHAELIPAAVALAADVAGNDRAGVRRIRRTYRDGALTTGAEALDLEARVSAEWLTGVAGDDVERRRQAVVDRGRNQI